jgi:hypothetical protein
MSFHFYTIPADGYSTPGPYHRDDLVTLKAPAADIENPVKLLKLSG